MKTIIISAIVFSLGLYSGIYIANAPKKTTKIEVGDCAKMKTSTIPFAYLVTAINGTDAELEMAPGLLMIYPIDQLEKTDCPK
jgi:hypothetical protein